MSDYFRLSEKEIEKLRTFEANPNPTVIPYLVLSYGLLEIYPYVKEKSVFLEEAAEWLQNRGTKRALQIALKWVDFPKARIVEREVGNYFFRFAVGVERVPTKEESGLIVKVAEISTPLRSKLTRIFLQEKDVRRLVLSSKSGKLSRCILSDSSNILS